jgi:putative restriction endonuclease
VAPQDLHAEQRLLDLIQNIRTWKKEGERAPHKPLLLLLALGRVQRGERRLMAFSDIEEKLRSLLQTYGPTRREHEPELPFWHLQSDGLWEVPEGARLKKRQGKNRPLSSEMQRARGGFQEDIQEQLRTNPELLRQVAHTLLDEHFPTSYHEDMVTAVGLEFTGRSSKRDPDFRGQVLNAYGHQCAICGLDPRVDGMSTALEAAHLRWHSHGGPSTIENGICLCPLHHKGLDLGVIGLSNDRRVLISSRLQGGEATEASFGRYHEQLLRGPMHGHPFVRPEYVKWHEEQVFKNPPRR